MAKSESNTSTETNLKYSGEKCDVSDENSTNSKQSQSILFTLEPDSQEIRESNSDDKTESTDPVNACNVDFNQDIQDCISKNNGNAITLSKGLEDSPENEEDTLSNSNKTTEDSQFNPSPPQPSKIRLKCTKRRAGVLYKQLTSSKMCKVTSKYFNQAHNTQKRWIPPRSPYALVQEDLFDKPWQLLVATVFLTKTAAKRALPQLHKFLDQFPLPEDVLQANYEDIDEYFKPLGLTTIRSHIIMRFTVEFLDKDWTYPRELYGIGKYGDDSYRMFCINDWRQVSPDDIPLTLYRNWLLENADRLGIT